MPCLYLLVMVLPVIVNKVYLCFSSSDSTPVVRRLQADDGRMLNVNEAK